MDRREFLISAVSGAILLPFSTGKTLAQPADATITHWRVRTAEGLDAVAFLGALSEGPLYLEYYGTEAAEFGKRLPPAILSDLKALREDAEKSGFGLLWPGLATIFSGSDFSTLRKIIEAASDPDRLLKPTYSASPYWDKSNWFWFTAATPRLQRAFQAMQAAHFPEFRESLVGTALDTRASELQAELQGFDVIREQRKLTGNMYDPGIEIVLLYFSKPHGVRVQGQRFLQSVEYDLTVTLRIAAHEVLHPPIDMKGRVAKRVLARLGRDPLFNRIAKQHDPKWGYTSAEGLLNEDICQALDQMIAERFGVAHNPADRWNRADDGIHVLAAALYGMLRADGWERNGGSISSWLDRAERNGRLAPANLHLAASRVLGRPANKLWPISTKTA